MKLPLNIQKTLTALFTAKGRTTPELRQAIVAYSQRAAGVNEPGGNVPAGLQPYLDKVANRAYQIGDKEIARLKTAGYSEDEIFEITASAAIGSGLGRLNQGLKALEESKRKP